jgi:hypothetical protein
MIARSPDLEAAIADARRRNRLVGLSAQQAEGVLRLLLAAEAVIDTATFEGGEYVVPATEFARMKLAYQGLF